MSVGKGTVENQQAIFLLEDAIRHLERGESAAAGWRVADAGELVAMAITAKGQTNVMGIHGPTGRGNQIVNIFKTIPFVEE